MSWRPIIYFVAAVVLAAQNSNVHPEMRRVRADLEFLTTDVLAGRASLTPQADIAARYIAAEFQKAGLRPANGDSYLQQFPLVAYRSDPDGRSLIMTRAGQRRVFKPGAEFTASFYSDVHIRAQLVLAGYGITAPEYGYDDYAGIDVKGKIALIFDQEPQQTNPKSIFNGEGHTLHAGRWMKVNNARKHGAVAVLIESSVLGKAPSLEPKRQNARASAPPQSLDDSGQIPAFSISDTVFNELVSTNASKLQEQIDSDLKPRSTALSDTFVEMHSRNAEQHRGMSMNVVGLIEGSDPQLKAETILMTAHYDHLGLQNGAVYPGANDNGSGTAGVMELARLFTEYHVKPRRSLLFIVFGSEEQLMLGSFYYTSHPLRPLETTRAVLNLDMIGRNEAHIAQDEGGLKIPADTSNGLNLIGSFYSPDLRALLERKNQPLGLHLEAKYDADRALNGLFRCDHLPFLIAHVPAVWLFGGFHPGYHEPSDTVDKLNFPKIEKVLELTYESALELANSERPPAFVSRQADRAE